MNIPDRIYEMLCRWQRGISVLVAKTPRLHSRLLQQLARRACVHLFHHRQQHAASGLGVGLGVVVVKIVADVRRQCGKLVIFQLWPDTAGELTGASIIKLQLGQAEMIQVRAQMLDVKGGIMGNHQIGVGQPGQYFRRNGGKFRGVQNIKMCQAVAFNEDFVKPAVAFGRSHQPIRGFCKLAIFKDSQTGSANAHARGIGGFKVQAGNLCLGNKISIIVPGSNPRNFALG